MNRSFTVVVEPDPETQWLVGEVVELPGCYTQAPDLPMLEANMPEAIRAYPILLSSSRTNRSPTLWAPGVLRSRLEQTSPGLMKIGDIGAVFLK
jgi:predicted RNase H-like HicB family nuclease